jgi:hypothetical protein
MFLELFGITLDTEEDVVSFLNGLARILEPLVKKKGRIKMVINYDGFDLRKGLEDVYSAKVATLEEKYYDSVKRFAGTAFRRAKLGKQIHMAEWDPKEMFAAFDKDGNGQLSAEEIRQGMNNIFHIHLTPAQLRKLGQGGEMQFDEEKFSEIILDLLKAHAEGV